MAVTGVSMPSATSLANSWVWWITSKVPPNCELSPMSRQRASSPDGLAARIPELKLPTLIMWGGRDRLIPPENAERFHRDIAGSTLVMFDDLGHAPDEEDPERTVVAVKQFLDLE